jgi:hypothetical protein
MGWCVVARQLIAATKTYEGLATNARSYTRESLFMNVRRSSPDNRAKIRGSPIR